MSKLSQFLSSPRAPSQSPSPGSRGVQGHPNSWANGTKPLEAPAASARCRGLGRGSSPRCPPGAASLGMGRQKRSCGAHRSTPGAGETGVPTSTLTDRHFLGHKEVSLRRACSGRVERLSLILAQSYVLQVASSPAHPPATYISFRHPCTMHCPGPISPLKSNATSFCLIWELTFCTLSL